MTLLRTNYGYYEYWVMQLRLVNISAIFQSYINMGLAEKLNIFCILHLDHIFIYTNKKKG